MLPRHYKKSICPASKAQEKIFVPRFYAARKKYVPRPLLLRPNMKINFAWYLNFKQSYRINALILVQVHYFPPGIGSTCLQQ